MFLLSSLRLFFSDVNKCFPVCTPRKLRCTEYRITSNNRRLFKISAERRALIRKKAGKMEDCATNCSCI